MGRGAVIDMTGTRFGRLVVLGRAANIGTSAAWLCKCDCGNTVTRSGGGLRLEQTKSCGCLRKEKLVDRNRRGRTINDEKTYEIWRGMSRRCYEPSNVSYKYYGENGVSVCDRWRKSFHAFAEDMGARPPGMSIDRIDPSGNYEPANCRWANVIDQNNNRRNVRKLMLNGVEMSITEACRATGINPVTAHNRIRLGWEIHTAVTHPVIKPTERAAFRKNAAKPRPGGSS